MVSRGDFAAACPKFAESQRLDPQLGTLLNLADCHEREGRLATAWSEFRMLGDLAARAHDAPRASHAQQRAARLEPSVPRARITVIDGLSLVKIDGATLGRPAWRTPLPLDPGPHTFEFATSGEIRWKQVILAQRGRTENVILRPHATEPKPVKQKPVDRRSGNPLIPTGYIALSVGAATIVVGSVFGIIALDKKATVNDHCKERRCDEDGYEAQADARDAGRLSTILFGVGGVLAATGGAMLIFAKDDRDAKSVGLVATGRGAAIRASF